MITIDNLSFRYQAKSPKVLDGVCLNIGEGERILFAGKNGAGKTTLSKIISGLIPRVEHGFVEGQYCYRNRPVSEYAPREFVREIAVLFQDFEAQIVSTMVREELVFYPMNTGLPYFKALENAKQLSAVFKAEAIFEREIDSLSGGEKQKTALLSLLSASPKMLILDEPFTDIDPASQELILDFIRHGEYRGGIILFDQSLDYHAFFDRIIILGEGKIRYDGDRKVIAEKALLSQAGLETAGIFKVLDSGYIATPETIIRHIRDNHVFDEDLYERIISNSEVSGENIVEVISLSFKYPECGMSLKNIDLKIRQGDFITVLGANGSGKTTLMKLIAGILDAKEGNILYQGRSLKKFPVTGKVGYVYQNPDNQIFAETVFDETAFILRMRGMAEDEIQGRVDAILMVMGLFDRKQSDPFSLPKGDRQKVACASILAGEPELIILDEPTTGLDHPSLKSLMKSVERLNSNGKTVIIITHSMETAANFGNKILALNQGEVFYYGDKRKFFEDDRLMDMGKVRRTEIMEMSLRLNGKLLLNENEFSMCWKKR
ncbi:MAG: energy-coupling factor transporter ATPase [Pseudomonadota bacterium]